MLQRGRKSAASRAPLPKQFNTARRHADGVITRRAVNLFRRWRAHDAPCTCIPDSTAHCAACAERINLELALRRELGIKPHEFEPLPPDAVCPYPGAASRPLGEGAIPLARLDPRRWLTMRPIALTDEQLKAIMQAAAPLPRKQRGRLLKQSPPRGEATNQSASFSRPRCPFLALAARAVSS
jgi:hypothetical protein